MTIYYCIDTLSGNILSRFDNKDEAIAYAKEDEYGTTAAFHWEGDPEVDVARVLVVDYTPAPTLEAQNEGM